MWIFTSEVRESFILELDKYQAYAVPLIGDLNIDIVMAAVERPSRVHYHPDQFVGALVICDRLEVEIFDCLDLLVDLVPSVVKPLKLEVETVWA